MFSANSFWVELKTQHCSFLLKKRRVIFFLSRLYFKFIGNKVYIYCNKIFVDHKSRFVAPAGFKWTSREELRTRLTTRWKQGWKCYVSLCKLFYDPKSVTGLHWGVISDRTWWWLMQEMKIGGGVPLMINPWRTCIESGTYKLIFMFDFYFGTGISLLLHFLFFYFVFDSYSNHKWFICSVPVWVSHRNIIGGATRLTSISWANTN